MIRDLKKYRYLMGLALVVVMAFLFRIVLIDRLPAGFTADEAGQGYMAYSLLKTGKDEWGEKFPIAPRSFGDYRAPLYAYLTVPSVAVFGLSVFATRLPGALVGTLAVVATYLLVSMIFENSKSLSLLCGESVSVNSKILGLVASLLLAISPWHIQLSRGAFEANLPTFLIPFGWWAFERSFRKSSWMVVSLISFGLGLFSYHSARFIIPIFVLILIIGKRRAFGRWRIKGMLERYWLAGVLFMVFLGLALATTFLGRGTRAADVAIFSPTGGWQTAFNARYEGYLLGEPVIVGKLFWNKLTYVLSVFTSSYLSYFSPQFLFTKGPGEATYGMIPGVGVLYLPELIFIPFALISFVKYRLWRVYPYAIIMAAILLAPIPAALAKGPGEAANRAAVMMPFIQIFSAIGLVLLFREIAKVIGKGWLGVVVVIVLLVSTISFWERYLYHGPMATAPQMSYGWGDLVGYLAKNERHYKNIIISHEFTEPQIFIAFFLKMNPVFLQAQSDDWLRYDGQGLKFIDQLGEYSLGKYTFRRIDYSSDAFAENVLLVSKGQELPADGNLLREIDYPDGKPAIRISRSVGQEYQK